MSTSTPAPDPQLLALQEALAGRYSIQRELGRGGMGVVYLAHEVVLDRPVALKVLPVELASDPVARERFLREARTAARLSHPHIVPIHAVDQVDEFVFFAMAYVDGQTLGERVRARGPLPPAEAARVLKEVAWALGYAHAQGVVHRDVKPDNILLEADTGRALVTDFGIAAAIRGDDDSSDDADVRLTGSREIVGTAEYMSPEQASGETADGRSDIYSLGVVGYYALSGRLPFQGDTVPATLAMHLTKAPPPLQRVAPQTPAPLAKVLDRCLSKNPNARYTNGEEMATALGGALQRRRDVPAPVRAFLEETQTQGNALATSIGFGVYVSLWTVGAAVTSAPWWALLPMAAFGLGFLLAPVGVVLSRIRKLLRSGHELDEVVRVLSDEIEERRRALALNDEAGGAATDRRLRALTWGGAATLVGGFAWLGWGPYIDSPVFWTLYVGLLVLGSVAFFAGGFASAVRDSVTRGLRGSRWLRLWESSAGQKLFDIAGVGLERQLPAGPGYRPTAVAIGMAAERLFEALPPPLRDEFHELPAVVDALETDAEAIRGEIHRLDDAMAELDPDSGPGVDTDRAGVADEIEATRALAEERLARVVGALESLRLHLIKMHAGIGSTELLTERLGHARAVAADIQRVVAGGREVDAMLGAAPPRQEAETPTPA